MAEPPGPWRIGVEIELLAPRGSTRRDLAEALAGPGGTVTTFFHPQSEPSKVPGTPVFDNLTPGFEAWDAAGALVARCVDDLTLQADLDRRAPPVPGWIRIVSDDGRLLRLVARRCDADAPLEAVLEPMAALFGTAVEAGPGGMRRVADELGVPVAIAAPLPGERERPCEIVSPPLYGDLDAALARLLGPARALGFTVPQEAAVHLHFDASPLCRARAVRALVRLWETWGPTLRALVGVNPRCRRLGGWPPALHAAVEAHDYANLAWSEARARLSEVGLSKYCDLNLKNIAHDVPGKHTIEVRVLPGTREPDDIIAAAGLFEAVLRRAVRDDVPRDDVSPVTGRSAERLLWALPLDDALRRRWLSRAAGLTR